MKAKDLIELLKTVPPDALIVRSVSDHDYQPVSAEVSTALDQGDDVLTEDYGEDITPESEYGKRINIVLIV